MAKKSKRRGLKASKTASQLHDGPSQAAKASLNKAGAAAPNPAGPRVNAVAKKQMAGARRIRTKRQKQLEDALKKRMDLLKDDIKEAFSEQAKEYMEHASSMDWDADSHRDVTITSQLQRLEAALRHKQEIEQKIATEIARLDEAYLQLSGEIAVILKGKLSDLEKMTDLLNQEK